MHENNCRTNKKYVGAAAFISKNLVLIDSKFTL